MKTKVNFLLVIALTFMAYACYPGGAEYVDELDTSISKYNNTYDWDNLDGKTYALPAEILHVKDGKEVDPPKEGPHDKDILKQIKSELDARGMIDATATAQDTAVAIAIVIIEQNNTGAAWIPGGGWWGGYPWYPGWGWGGYYPWYPVYYSYKTGSVLIEMGDYANKDEEEETMPLVYTGVLDGLLQGNENYIGARIENGIDELFNKHEPFN